MDKKSFQIETLPWWGQIIAGLGLLGLVYWAMQLKGMVLAWLAFWAAGVATVAGMFSIMNGVSDGSVKLWNTAAARAQEMKKEAAAKAASQ